MSDFLSHNEARERIQHEDNLINHRSSWMIGSQSFLITAFVLLHTVPSVPIQKLALLIYLTLVVGIVISIFSFISIVSAFIAINSWKAKSGEEEQYSLISGMILHFCGSLSSILPGPVLASVWILLMVEESSTLHHLSGCQIRTPWIVIVCTSILWFMYVWCTSKGSKGTQEAKKSSSSAI